MKRVLISLGIGLLIIPMLLLVLLMVKTFSPASYPPAILWTVSWTYTLLCRLPYISVTAGEVVVSSLIGDYLILSFLAYFGLSVGSRLSRKKTRLTPPPPPSMGDPPNSLS